MINCPLCEIKTSNTPFYRDKTRSYIRCVTCDLVFVSPEFRISKQDEKDRYDSHINFSDDSNYRKFLSQALNPTLKLLKKSSNGLDFGSGPGPTLHTMFEDHGHTMSIYDPFYAKNDAVFETKYDFITATEVVEHLYTPLKTLNKVWECLNPDGLLTIMTETQPKEFSTWWYKNDKTHVSFFSDISIEWLNEYWKSKIVFKDKKVVIIKKG
jgi:hypothetical protein